MNTFNKVFLLAVGAIAGGIIIGCIVLMRGTPATGSLNTRNYTNDEKWSFVRDTKTGRITDVSVKRSAKESN